MDMTQTPTNILIKEISMKLKQNSLFCRFEMFVLTNPIESLISSETNWLFYFCLVGLSVAL